MRRSRVLAFAALLVPLVVATPTVTVGSKNFTESTVLAEVMAAALEERAGLHVERRLDLGGTFLCFEALRAGAIDVYPEYTGTGLVAILEEEPPRDPLAAFLRVRRAFEDRFGLAWGEPFGCENTYAIALPREEALRLGVRTLSDLVPRAREMRLGASSEFLERPDGLRALEARYGLAFRDARGMSHELAYRALAERRVDAIDAYVTDPEVEREGLVLLADDRGAFPPYHAAPLARRDLPAGAREALGWLAGRLSTARVRELNRAVLDGAPPREVALRFVSEELHRSVPPAARTRAAAPVPRWTAEHLVLAGLALVVSTALGVPAGILVARRERVARLLLGTLGVVQTVPSLALLGLLLPVLGIGFVPALVALVLYGLLPVVHGTVVGLHSVDAELRETAAALGLTPAQSLRAIELPLALEGIVGGIRTSAVIAVGTATLAAFIGAGGLGEPIFTGLRLARTDLILAGAVPAALLALAVDAGLGRVERHLRG